MPMSIFIFFNSILCISLLGIQFFLHLCSLSLSCDLSYCSQLPFPFISGDFNRGALKPAKPPFGWDVLLCCHFEDACFDEEPESWEALLEEKAKYNTLNANRYLHTFRLGMSSHFV